MTSQEESRQPLINTNQNNDDRIRRFPSSILNILSTTTSSSSQRDRQTFGTAFIQSATILFIFACGACALLAYRVLEPFLRSILWSILAGAFLFPLKKHLTNIARSSLEQLDTNSHLLFYGLVIVLPLKTFDQTIKSIGPLCSRYQNKLLIICLILIINNLFQTGFIYYWLTIISYHFINTFICFIHFFDSIWIITLIIGYLLAVLFIYDYSPLIKNLLNFFSIPIWIVLLIYLSQFLSVTYRLIVVSLSIILTVVGFIFDLKEHIDQNSTQNENQHRISIFTNLIDLFKRLHKYNQTETTQSSSSITLISSASSTPYFTFVLWSLVAIKVYQFYHYLFVIFIFIFIYTIIKNLIKIIYNYLIQQETIKDIIKNIKNFLKDRRDVLTPSPLQGLVQFLIKGDKKFNHGLQASIDYLVSAFMIVTLLITVLFGSIFLIIQIQHESIHMIKLTSNLVNETIVLQRTLPDKEYLNKLMDTVVNNTYSAGKTWITKQVNLLNQDNETNIKLEKDILQLWDNLYDYMSNTSIPNNNFNTSIYSFTNRTIIISNLKYYFNDLYNLIRNNLHILRTVFDSIWTNTTLLLTLLSTIISLLFTGGFALFNFFVSFIVFVTLLFYLLSNSNQPIYQPTEWLNNTLAIGGKGLGKAVNDAVTSVFVASLKIAIFYGLYTYVLHTIVGSNLVFLPAVIALICAVTLKSYWAALPGCLDLWIVQQRPIGALILLLGQIAPVYVVDTAIYSEVKGGGHQYLTALAIAGGVYYRGIEGALIGPIVLCCLLVGVRLYNETMATTLSPNHERESLRNLLSHTIYPRPRPRTRSLQLMTTN